MEECVEISVHETVSCIKCFLISSPPHTNLDSRMFYFKVSLLKCEYGTHRVFLILFSTIIRIHSWFRHTLQYIKRCLFCEMPLFMTGQPVTSKKTQVPSNQHCQFIFNIVLFGLSIVCRICLSIFSLACVKTYNKCLCWFLRKSRMELKY